MPARSDSGSVPIRRFAVLGHPVGHSVSPAMHRAALQALGLPHLYQAIDVPSTDELARIVGEIRAGVFHGVNVTVPYKRAVLDLADDVDQSAADLGAANTLVHRKGHVIAFNTDVAGLFDDLSSRGVAPRTAAIIGAGGGAIAAVAACVRLGAGVIAVTSRSWTGSESLVSPVTEKFRSMGALVCAWPSAPLDPEGSTSFSRAARLQWGEFAARADLIIQSTSAGMKGADPGSTVADIVPWEGVPKTAFAYDLVYNPTETPFLDAARRAGLEGTAGLGMLVRQGAHSLTLWLGVTPDIAIMRRAAERALTPRT